MGRRGTRTGHWGGRRIAGCGNERERPIRVVPRRWLGHLLLDSRSHRRLLACGRIGRRLSGTWLIRSDRDRADLFWRRNRSRSRWRRRPGRRGCRSGRRIDARRVGGRSRRGRRAVYARPRRRLHRNGTRREGNSASGRRRRRIGEDWDGRYCARPCAHRCWYIDRLLLARHEPFARACAIRLRLTGNAPL